MKALSQAALGRALGLSPAMVTKLKHQGMPVTSVTAAKRWRQKHMDPSYLKENKAPAMTDGPPRRQRAEVDDEEDDGQPADSADTFIGAALFARTHGIRRYGSMLVHLWLLLSDEARAEVEQSDEMPQSVWDAWDDLAAKYFATFGKFDENDDGPAPG